MKKFSLIATLLIAVMLIVGCSHNVEANKNADESLTVSFSASNTENYNREIVTENESSTQISTTESTTAETTKNAIKETEKQTTTTTKPTEKKSSNQSSTTTTKRTTTTTKKSETTTKKQTTTQKPTTTTTTTKKATTTTKKQGLTKADVEWVQKKANEYIRSKGMTVDSSVGSFSGKISTHNFKSKESLLEYVKGDIDGEYQECINAGWSDIYMYCKIESRSDGSFFIYVMYG